MAPVLSKESLDIQATIECRFTLKRVRDMIITYSFIRDCSRIFLKQCPSWAGYISVKFTNQTMLSIINSPATDMTALHSLLCFVAVSCANNINLPTPAVTFDQPLYVKTDEIVSTKNTKIFVRLGGFHQLMSFLGSIGCLMEGSGLQTALECVYVQLTVGHTFSKKPTFVRYVDICYVHRPSYLYFWYILWLL